MRDAIALEEMGRPTVLLVHDVFENAAKLQASVLSNFDLRMAIFPYPKPQETKKDVDEHARLVLERVKAFG